MVPPFALAFLLGLVAGLRAFVAAAAISWAAYFGRFPVAGTHFAFLGNIATPIVFTLLAIAEIVYEVMPRSPGNRLFLAKLLFRVVVGAFVGAVIGSSQQTHALWVCAAFGGFGAIAGSFLSTGLFEFLQNRVGNIRQATFIQNTVAVLTALLVLIPITKLPPH